jgi:hypothetical protein
VDPLCPTARASSFLVINRDFLPVPRAHARTRARGGHREGQLAPLRPVHDALKKGETGECQCVLPAECTVVARLNDRLRQPI